MIPESKIWRPFTQMQIAAPAERVVSAEGASFTLESGEKLLDGISSWWVITHGHSEPKIVEAIARQVRKFSQIQFANFSHAPAEEFAANLTNRLPEDLTKVFFSDNGSTAVEVAMKMAVQARSQQQGEDKDRRLFLALENSYHGDTVGAMSAGARSLFSDPYKTMLFEVLHAKGAAKVEDPAPMDWAKDALEIIEKRASEIVAIILEPLVQGAGGMIMWPREAVELIVDAAKAKGILVIFDEIMTGFGRTGKLFAFEHMRVTPDLLCLSKGLTAGFLPLSVTVATDAIYSAFLSESKTKMFFHGHSFTGNALSVAAALENLELCAEPEFQTRLENLSVWQKQELMNLAENPLVQNPRACGTIAAFDLVLNGAKSGYANTIGEKLFRFAKDRGVYLRPLGNTCYVLPPYCISREDLRKIWSVLAEFAEMAKA